MMKKHLPLAVTCLAVAGLAWACEDGPQEPAKADFPLVAAPDTAKAPPARAHRGPGARGMISRILEDAEALGLTEDQMTRLEAKMELVPEKPFSMKGEMKAHRAEMHELMKAESLDEAGILAKHDARQAESRQMREKMFAGFLDVLEILTPDQRIKMHELMREKHGEKAWGPGPCKGECAAACDGPCKDGCDGECAGPCKSGMKHHGMKGKWGHKGPGGMLLRAMKVLGDEIGQTEEQKAEIRAIMKQAREDKTPLKEKMRALHEEMRALMTAPQLDRAAIEAKHSEILDIQDQMASSRFALVIQSLKVLSVEQRVQMFGILDECRGKKGEGVCKELIKGMKHKGHGMHGSHENLEAMAW